MPRQKSSSAALAIEWDYAVYTPKGERKENKASKYSFGDTGALERHKAFEWIASDDRRPMLVMRECNWCEGTDDALLSTRLSNERTELMARWFHMVKLPAHVLEAGHPFSKLFPERKPPHLFICRFDGSEAVELPGDQSQQELWAVMFEALERDYDGNAERSLKSLAKLLDKYDDIDAKEALVEARFEQTIEKHGPQSGKLKSLRKDLGKLATQREKLDAELAEASALTLKAAVMPADGPVETAAR